MWREDLSLKRVYVLLSAYEDGGIVPVQLEVKEYTDKNNKLYMAVTLNKISTEVKALRRGQNSPLINASSVDTISVRELVEKINPSDGKFLRYIPDGMLNDEQIAAKRAADETSTKKTVRIPWRAKALSYPRKAIALLRIAPCVTLPPLTSLYHRKTVMSILIYAKMRKMILKKMKKPLTRPRK